jgi:phosphatidylserine/phosphatidylglycerophosphate/cardiolipin synthase-like enzyme
MAEFLSTAGASNAIEQMIKSSKKRLYLISPYLQINPLLKSLLQQLDNKVSTIDIRFVSRTDKINADDMNFLQNLNGVRVLALDNLHAKCYLNEEIAILTSLNLYQYSQHNNIEMGIKVTQSVDGELYAAINDEVERILGESRPYQIKLLEKDKKEDVVKEKQIANEISKTAEYSKDQSKRMGYCIRCASKMPLNPERPLCNSCYQSWARFGDPKYPEKFCHICGKESKQTYEKPVCYSCYKKYNK